MKKIKLLAANIILLAGISDAFGFVMIGPSDLNGTVAIGGGNVGTNLGDEMGGPTELKTFFRVNNPHLTYAFDLSFVRYFGIEGMEAVHDAVHVINDFFVPVDGSYEGVSSIDYARDGYLSNYNTAWVNTTAENQQVLDLKSLTLGIMLNQLGVGNPHRYAFSIKGIAANAANSQWNFNVVLRNYDPITWQPTDKINGVTYSYRLIHDANGTGGGTINTPTTADMEEFTTDTSGNAWTAVSSITDSFYGGTSIYWTDSPTLFNFGVYYDGMNAMGGQYQARHALTYDDVGALKYLYRTNNFVYEDNNGTLVTPANFLTGSIANNFLNPSNGFGAFGAGNPSMRGTHTFPRRGGGTVLTPNFMFTSPFRNPSTLAGQSPNIPIIGVANPALPGGKMGMALRGGIDKIQFYPVAYDSLMHNVYSPTNFVWTDTFVTNNSFNVLGLNNTTAGASAYFGGAPNPVFVSQVLGRNVTSPDILFQVADLGDDNAGIPIAWNRTDNGGWNANPGVNQSGLIMGAGPGVINISGGGNATGTVYNFGRMSEGFEVIWSGEASVVGNQNTYSMWGHIKGPGPEDVVIFSTDNMLLRMENEISPQVAVPTISMVSNDGGVTPIAPDSLIRTQETLTIIGTGLGGGTAIEIMNGDLVVQTLFPVDKYLVSDQRIDLPAGVVGLEAEGIARQVRVWNTVGVSDKSTHTFSVYTGPAVVTGTSRDQQIFDRAQPLIVYGMGFKSTNIRAADGSVGLSHFRVEDGLGNAVLPTAGAVSTAVTWEIVSDTMAVLPLNSMTSAVDGDYRRLRVSRDVAGLTMSVTNSVALISVVTTTPVISTFHTINLAASSTLIGNAVPLRRDRALELNGTAMNTTYAVEIVNEDGSSFANPLVINLPNAGVTVDANGTRIQISMNTFAGMPEADGHAANQRRRFKVYNAIGTVLSAAASSFNVNEQPVFSGFGGLSAIGLATGGAFNHSPAGDDVTIVGSGLQAVNQIHILDRALAALSTPVFITLPSPGVTVTDTSIVIDTSAQQFPSSVAAATALNSIVATGDRRFQLQTGVGTAWVANERDDVNSDGTTPFIAGIAPTYTSTAGTSVTGVDLRRDVTGTLTFTGTGLGLMTGFELVDASGNTIPTVPVLTTSTGVAVTSATVLTLTVPATTLASYSHLLDDSLELAGPIGQRRMKVSTPFGSVTSLVADGFTISALPAISGAAATAYGGLGLGGAVNGFNAGTVTYDSANGLLILNDTIGTFQGLNTVTFEDNSTTPVVFKTETLNPDAPPSGVYFFADGTKITFTKAYLDTTAPGWVNSGGVANRRLRVTTAANISTATSPEIISTGNPPTTAGIVIADSGGYAHPNLNRNGVLTINAVNGANLSAVTSATLVNALGTTAGVTTPLAFGSFTSRTASQIVIALDTLIVAGEAEFGDSYNPNRRLLLADPGGNIISSQAFTVSDLSLDVIGGATPDEIYSGTRYHVGSDSYDSSASTGTLTIVCDEAVPGRDMNGVVSIEFADTGTVGAPFPGTITMSRDAGDFTVDAAGVTITIAGTVIAAKGGTAGAVGAGWLGDSTPAAFTRRFALIMPNGDRIYTHGIDVDVTP